MYGGWDPTQTKYFDEIWVLSLPSFTWIQVYTGTAPRFAHTCHMPSPSRAITVGGLRYADPLRECDWEYKSIAVYNLNSGEWSSEWDPAAPAYEVPEKISGIVGGNANGSATKLVPDKGWTSIQIAELFTGSSNQTAPAHVSSQSTRAGGGSGGGQGTNIRAGGMSKGTIAAVAVGVVVFFLLALLGAVYLLRLRRTTVRGGNSENESVHENRMSSSASNPRDSRHNGWATDIMT